MPGPDTTSYDAVLKTVYEGGIRDQIKTRVKTLELFMEGESAAWGGRHVEYPITVARTEGSGWATELGNLPTAGREEYTDVRIPCRYQYGRISLSAQVMKASQGGRNAFRPAMEREMEGIIKTMSADRGRAIFHDGRGILALVNGAATSATQTLDAPGGVAGATNGSRFIRKGMIIGCINATTGAVRATTVATVSSVAAAGATIGLDVSRTWTDNDYVVRFATTGSTAVGDTSYNKEFMGLLGHVDDGTYVATYQNVNRTTYPIFQSQVIGTAAAPVGALSDDLIQRGIDAADERGDGETSDLLCHHSVRRAYIAITVNDRRYIGADLTKPDAGTAAAKKGTLAFGGIPIREDKYAPYGLMFGVDRSGFKRYALVDGEWADEDGAILARVGTGSTAQDAFEGYYRMWDNFINDYPNRSFRLDGVTATVSVVSVP